MTIKQMTKKDMRIVAEARVLDAVAAWFNDSTNDKLQAIIDAEIELRRVQKL